MTSKVQYIGTPGPGVEPDFEGTLVNVRESSSHYNRVSEISEESLDDLGCLSLHFIHEETL